MLKFALKNMLIRRARLLLVTLSIVLSASVALLSFNISRQVNEGIITTAGYYDLIIGPAGSATQLAMNTMFFTDEPLGTISYEYVDAKVSSRKYSSFFPVPFRSFPAKYKIVREMLPGRSCFGRINTSACERLPPSSCALRWAFRSVRAYEPQPAPQPAHTDA